MRLSPTELTSHTLNPETLQFALQAIRVNGYIVLEEVLSPDFIAPLREEFMRVFSDHTARVDPNRGANRYQMHLPFRAPFNDESIIANPLAL